MWQAIEKVLLEDSLCSPRSESQLTELSPVLGSQLQEVRSSGQETGGSGSSRCSTDQYHELSPVTPVLHIPDSDHDNNYHCKVIKGRVHLFHESVSL